MGAGVPRPVHPKSQTQRMATAKPRTEGTAASQRQRAAPAVETANPSQPGSSQNHSAKKAQPTASEARAVGQGCVLFGAEAAAFSGIYSSTVTARAYRG